MDKVNILEDPTLVKFEKFDKDFDPEIQDTRKVEIEMIEKFMSRENVAMYMIHERQHFPVASDEQEERALIPSPVINSAFLTNMQQFFLQNKYFVAALIDFDAEPDYENLHALMRSEALDIRRVVEFWESEKSLFKIFEDFITKLFGVTYEDIWSKSMFDGKYEWVS